MVKQKIAIFDLDGTLIDSSAKLKADVISAFHRLGYQVSPENIGENWYDLARSRGITREAFDEEFDKRKTWAASLRDGEVAVFADTKSSLEKIAKAGITMALLSKSLPKYTDTKLDFFGLRKYFTAIRTTSPTELTKDDGAIKLVRELGPNNISLATFIGDNAIDLSCERAVAEYYNNQFQTRGVYVNRDGKSIKGYCSVKTLSEVADLLIQNGR